MNSEIVKYKRLLNIDLPKKQSAFLWGARQTGKSTHLHDSFLDAVYIDLLQSEKIIKYSKQPHVLRQEVLALSAEQLQHPIILDEIQKVPALLNEIHWLIENTEAQFILCGSSARKLKRGAANLLGGRAWRFEFYPLVTPEIPNFDLLHAFNNGLLPKHYTLQNATRSLRAYVSDYLAEEIQAEGLVRNLPAFARFLDAAAFCSGELVNYNNIARDCGVDSKTVKEYFQILVDTLLGYYVEPFRKTAKREIIGATPKFYLFDVGVLNHLRKRTVNIIKGIEAGDSLEHFIMMELMAYRGLMEKDFSINYWRTKTQLEVDFILNNGEFALEVKVSDLVTKADIKGLLAFCEEHKPKAAYVISQDKYARKLDQHNGTPIVILPWREFLQKLWAGDLV